MSNRSGAPSRLPAVDHATNRGWYPVAASSDAVPGHVVSGRLWGSDLVIWRDDNGAVNVWPDRCLHRGVRLSLGTNTGSELVCRYHGWRYASVAGSCTYIPAHPDNAPPQSLCTATLPVHEHADLIWTTLDGAPGSGAAGNVANPFPSDGDRVDGEAVALWSVHVRANAHSVVEQAAVLRAALLEALDLPQGTGADVKIVVQPVDPDVAAVRPIIVGAEPESIGVEQHRAAAAVVSEFARTVERRTGPEAQSGPISAAGFGQVVAQGRSVSTTLLDVEVAAKWPTAEGIMAFEFVSVDGRPLPAIQPGSHIDVHMTDDLLRPYSLTNGPGDTVYRIGVKREPESRGGSVTMHDAVSVGDRLRISRPRNNFPLRRDSEFTLFIAGGIGVTPLLAMAQTLAATEARFGLHYFVRGADHMAFADVVEALGASAVVHSGLDPSATGDVLEELLAGPGFGRQVYACGPGPMLDAIRATARSIGWADEAIHFEYFQNPNEVDLDSSFEIALSRSARTLTVSPGETILDVLRAAEVPVQASCEQGACGTCVVPLLDGRAIHQDVYLSDSQRAAQDRIAVCVSRAETERLVLEL